MNNRTRKKSLPHRSTLALALALGLGVSGFAFAQATTGTIFGNTQAVAGETVTVSSNNGIVRTVPVNAQGQYTIGNLPLGVYTATLKKDGAVVGQHNNITIQVGAGTQVNFITASAQNAKSLGAVQVSANTMPAIDVTSVSSSTVITARQLQRLPVGRSAEDIALLAPGAVSGNSFFGNAVSFGGSGITENAYYINGYNTSDPFRDIGGFQLPYGSIAQQQTYTGGYSAKYGRSDGGVINQVGKRGTNQWHFGGQVTWSPRSLSSGGKNVYYPIEAVPKGFTVANPDKQGTIRRYRNDNKSWETTYSAYVGGPLVKNKLFAFFSIQTTKDKYNNVSNSVPPATKSIYSTHSTQTYGKLDWNINSNNILELTSLTSDSTGAGNAGDGGLGKGATYNYDYATHQATGFRNPTDAYVNDAKFLIAKYTSYIGNNATLSVTWGRGEFKNYFEYGNNSKLPYIYNVQLQRGDVGETNAQSRLYNHEPDAANSTRGLRADFTYQLGNHKLGIGIDDMNDTASHQGQVMSGPGYMWEYGQGKPNDPIAEGLGVGAPGGDGYYVSRYVFADASNMSLEQKAYYIQDVWNVTDRFQLNLGLRNDHFINKNSQGIAFVNEKNQWEPRIGFSWDVNGDSSLKIYGNAGRYYLALPDSVAVRAADPSTFTNQYYTYDGINSDGIPQHLQPVLSADGSNPGPVSADNETGKPKDAHTVTATNLKAQYQDEYILGFDKTLGNSWVYGAKATYRDLKAAIDDVCAPGKISDKMKAMGLDPSQYDVADPGCRIFNPGRTNHFDVARKDGSGYADVTMSTGDWGFKQGAKRKYYALDLYLSHPFDGKWSGRIDYTFARSWGNTEGQVRSDIHQADISKTEDWDNPYIMSHSYGYLANDHRHQLKARGTYQITPEWMVSGVLRIESGAPRSCLGFYGPDGTDPAGYGSNYHWCNGQPASPGSTGFTPWTHQLNLGVRYTPAFARHKLAFKLNVFNVFNEQKALQLTPVYAAGKGVISNTYGMAEYFEPPRFIRLSVAYNY